MNVKKRSLIKTAFINIETKFSIFFEQDKSSTESEDASSATAVKDLRSSGDDGPLSRERSDDEPRDLARSASVGRISTTISASPWAPSVFEFFLNLTRNSSSS